MLNRVIMPVVLFAKLLTTPGGMLRVGALATLALVAGPAPAVKLDCEVIGTQYAEWRDNDYQMAQSKAYRRVHRIAFVTGERPRIAYLGKQAAEWIWEDLEVVTTDVGVVYSSVLSRGGVLTAVLNDAETHIVINYTGETGASDGQSAIYSSTGIGQCVQR